MIDNKTPPDLVLDSTRSGVISKVVKMMTKKLGLPTLSMSYGQMDDIIGQYPISYHIDHISNTVNSLNNWQDFWNLNLLRIKEITDDNFCIYISTFLILFKENWQQVQYDTPKEGMVLKNPYIT